MISVAAAQEMSREAAVRAAKNKEEPLYFWPEDTENDDQLSKQLRNTPYLGTYVPRGWERLEETYFVDSSGFGQPGEPALTLDQFMGYLKKNLDVAYAIVEAGEFQVKIGTFRKLR